MKNKKGFTLVELLCVIVLLAILTVMATAGIMNLSNKSKTNLYCAKIKMIESIASDYGIKLEKQINNSTIDYLGHKSITIQVSTLVDAGKLDADSDGIVVNPVDNSSMNDMDIILTIENNAIKAYIDTNNVC